MIDAGAPRDEYDALTNKLLSGAINQVGITTLRNDILNLLDNYYETPNYSELSNVNKVKLSREIDGLIAKIIKTNANSG